MAEVITVKFQSDITDIENSFSKLSETADKFPEKFKEVKTAIKGAMDEFNDGMKNVDEDSFVNLPGHMQESMLTMLDSAKTRLASMLDSIGKAGSSESLSKDITQNMQRSLAYLTTNLSTMFSANGSVGKILTSIPETLRKDFTSEFMDISRSVSSIFKNATYSSGLGPRTDSSLMKTLKQNEVFSPAFSKVAQKFGLNQTQQDELLTSLIKLNASSTGRMDYLNKVAKLSNGTVVKRDIIPEYSSFRDRLPERYKNIPDVPQLTTIKRARASGKYDGQLTKAEYDAVKKLAEENPTFENALAMSGVATRVSRKDGARFAGTLVMPREPISKLKLAQALGYMDTEYFRPALEGAPMYYAKVGDPNYDIQKKQANKSSRVPRESYAAFETLQEIVDPLYVKKPSSKMKYIYTPQESVALDSDVSIRPNSYQIQSLTYDDFISGKILHPTNDKRYNLDEEIPKGVSANKMISQSIYTDLLGMFGNQTFGNGKKTINVNANGDLVYGKDDIPKILQMDLSDIYFETNNDGLVFENGRPKQNLRTKELITQMFTPKASIKNDNGESIYNYPVIDYGSHGRYVPTNIKNGIITLAEEAAYVNASKPFIEKYGVNVFDNLAENEEFSSLEKLNKPIEARNRLLTPGVPFSQIGGSMPDKHKVAFVDLETLTGHNGSSFFMPGYLPGGDLTLRTVGFKGVGQSQDYKQMIRDVYGKDIEEFYLPQVNAPEEMKKLFKERGIDAVKGMYLNNPSRKFEEDFLNIMDYDALITGSMLKTPIYNGKSNSEMQDIFYDIQAMTGGMRGVQTAKGFESTQNSLSRQVSQNLDMTIEQAEANQKKWNEYIYRLQNDPEFIKEKLFSDKNDVLSQKIQSEGNDSLLWQDPEARSRINNAIESALQSKMYGEIFADKNELSMHLALSNFGEQMLRTGKMNNLDIQNKELADVLGMGYDIQDKDNPNYIAFGSGSKPADFIKQIAAWRYPNNVLEQFPVSLAEDYMRIMSKYGMNKYGAYMNMATIAKMGGGDVDGDTIQRAQGNIAELAKQTYATRQSQIGDYTVPNLKSDSVEFSKRKMKPEDMADLLYRQASASFEMSAINNAMNSLSQGNWNDKDFAKMYGKGGLDLKAMYDIDSTFQKTGVLAKWTSEARNVKNLGIPFVSVFRNLQGAINTGDFTKLGDFSKINFPSRYNALTVSMLKSLQNNPMSSSSVETLIEAQERLQGIPELLASNSPLDNAKGEYLKKNISLISQMLTGRGMVLSNESQDDLDVLLGKWSTALSDYERANKGNVPDDVLKRLRHEYNDQVSRSKHRKMFGLTEESVLNGEGYANPSIGFLKDARLTDSKTLFDSISDGINDSLRTKAAITAGGNNLIVGSLIGSANNAQKAAAIAEAENRQYSWSNLHSFETNPKKWYDRYILGQHEPDTRATIFGKAVHAAQEAWAKKRIANNEDYGTAEEYEKIFNDYLITTSEGNKDAENLFPELPNRKSGLFSKDEVDKYERILKYVRHLPSMLKNEKILGAEIKMGEGDEPGLNLGNRIGNPNLPVNTIGFIDLRSMDKEGNIIHTDLKPYLNYPSVQDQLNMYNPDRRAAFKRVMAYDEPNADYRRPETFIHTTPYSEDAIKKTEEQQRRNYEKIYEFAQTGNMAEMLFSIANVGKDNPVLSYSSMMDRRSAAFTRDYEEKKDAEQNIKDENTQSDEEKELYSKYEKERSLIDKKTGTGIAKAISLQNDITDYSKELTELGNTFHSLQTKKEKVGNSVGNKWDMYEYQLNDYDRQRNILYARGANELELGELDNSFNRAYTNYQNALRVSSYSDIESLTNSLNKEIESHGTSSSAKQYVKEFDELEVSIEKAHQAYVKFSEEVEGKKKTGTATKDDIDALDRATNSDAELMNKVTEYKEILSQDANSELQKRLDNFNQLATGKPLSSDQKIDRQVSDFALNVSKMRNDLSLYKDKNVISEEDYKKYIEGLDSLNVGDYKRYLENNSKLIEEQRSNQERARVDQQLMRMNQYDMQRNGVYDNSFVGQILRMRDTNQSQLAYQISSGESLLTSLKQKQLTQTEGTDAYNQTTNDINRLEEALNRAKTAMEGLNGASGIAQTAMTKLSQSVTNAISRFGRQMFQKALNEAKKFTVEFSSSMAQIQAITMKSDTEMDPIRKQTISKAINMKTSVSDVAKVETDLYRQGLSDSKVSNRTDAILKFATVSGTKVNDATKIITTALQNGLVNSAEEAMDALVALGDSAATTAGQIGKAMQKCAAAAKVAGVSYSELTAMLTTMTSMTQLSGTQIGTAMNTILSRMHKVTTSGLTKDINGETTGINDIEQALSSIGISLRDVETGEWAPTSQVLLQLAQQWDSISDIQKSNITTTMAGTRAGNLFTTLMEGMSEDNGETFAKYLGLAEDSEGITESKYDIVIKNITASINEMKSAFDGLIESLESDQIISAPIKIITSIFEGITSFTENAGGIATALALIGTAIVAFVTKVKLASSIANPALGFISTIAGIGVALLGATAISTVGELTNGREEKIELEKQTSIKTQETYISASKDKISYYKELIDETKDLGKAYEEFGNELDKDKSDKLESNLKNLISIFPELGSSIDDTTGILEHWVEIINGANESVEGIETTSRKTARVLSHNAAAKNFNDEVEAALDEIDNLGFTREDIGALENNATMFLKLYNSNEYGISEFSNGLLSSDAILDLIFQGDKEAIDYFKNNEYLNNSDINSLYGFDANAYKLSLVENDKSLLGSDVIKEGLLKYLVSNNDVSKYNQETLDFLYSIGLGPKKKVTGYTSDGSDLLTPTDVILNALKDDEDKESLLALKRYFIDDNRNTYSARAVQEFNDRFGNLGLFKELVDYSSVSYNELTETDWSKIILKFNELQNIPDQIMDSILSAFDPSNFKLSYDQKQKVFDDIYNSTLSPYGNREMNVFTNPENVKNWLISFQTGNKIGFRDGEMYSEIDEDQKNTVIGLLDYMYRNNYFANSSNWMYQDKNDGLMKNIYTSPEDFINDASAGFEKMRSYENGTQWLYEISERLFSAITDDNNSVVYSYFDALDEQMQEVLSKQVGNFHDKYSSDAKFMDDEYGLVEKAAMNYVISKAIDDGYVDDKGNVVYSTDWVNDVVLGDYFESAYESLMTKYNQWGQEVGLREFLNVNGIKPEDYPYQFNGQGYTSLEDARNAARVSVGINKESDYSYNEQMELNKTYQQILDSEGKSIYDSAGNIIASQMQNYLLNNKDYKTDLMTMLTFAQSAGNIGEFNKVVPTDNLNAILSANTELNAIWNAVTNGDSLFNFEDLQSALMNAYAGTPIFSSEMFEEKMNTMFGTENQTFMERLMTGNFGTETDRSTYLDFLQQDEATKQMISSMRDEYSSLGPIFDSLVSGIEITDEQIKAFNEEFNQKNAENIREYGENLQTVTDNMYKLRKGTATERNSVLAGMRQRAQTVNDNEYYRKQLEAGKMSNDIAEYYASVSGYDANYIKKNKGIQKELISQNDIYRQMDLDMLKPDAETLMEILQQGVQNDPEFANMVINGELPGITYNLETGSLTINTGEIDSSIAQNATYQVLDDAATAAANMEVQAQMNIDQSVDANGNTILATAKATLGGVTVKGLDKSTGTAKMKKSGGGGGKSKTDKLIESLQRNQKLGEHRIKMIQYQEADYKDDSQLGNYGKAVEEENRVRKEYSETLNDNLESLKKEFAATKKDSDDWYKLRDQILATEEAIEENNKAIEDNVRLLAENHQAILKLHTDLEQLIVDEINARKQKERDMLDGTVQMESQILNIIQERYRKEWELEKQGVEKKKEALEEEKRLLQERLDARKEAEDEAAKYEELEEMKKQLAIIEMDSTRTKDAKEMRKKIADLERDIAYDSMQDQVDAQSEAIDDQEKALDDYVNDHEEDLNDMLNNAQNFADEVNRIMGMSHDDLMQWLKENDEEYLNSLDDVREQMLQNWDDTWKQMKGIVDTYWDEINMLLSSKDKFIEYMKQSDSYVNASQDEKAQMEYNWGQMYDNWIKAQPTNGEVGHTDLDMSGSGISSGSGPGGSLPTTEDATEKNVSNDVKTNNHYYSMSGTYMGKKLTEAFLVDKSVSLDDMKRNLGNVGWRDVTGYKIFKSGGYVNYTGPAWVDGTPSKPEAFLDSYDTSLLRSMLDAFKYASSNIRMTNIGNEMFGGSNNASIGEVNIEITEASFKEDADYEEVARRVGDAFTKELAKSGFSTANYNF